MPFKISLQIGTAEPVVVEYDIANTKATEMLKAYATYIGIDITGKTVRQVGDLVARAQARAMWEGARSIQINNRRTATEATIQQEVDTELPPLTAVGDTPTQPVPPSS